MKTVRRNISSMITVLHKYKYKYIYIVGVCMQCST